ncbi:Uncharacterised protein [Mycobacteroides abscessus subsp. abscessus]|nr:Uncharacterised protein [Mycobacteroides abscessus subsp. abscessus]
MLPAATVCSPADANGASLTGWPSMTPVTSTPSVSGTATTTSVVTSTVVASDTRGGAGSPSAGRSAKNTTRSAIVGIPMAVSLSQY